MVYSPQQFGALASDIRYNLALDYTHVRLGCSIRICYQLAAMGRHHNIRASANKTALSAAAGRSNHYRDITELFKVLEIDKRTKSPCVNEDTVIAIDLGSNSFHLLEARLGAAGLETVAVHAQKVQLGLGMTDALLPAAIARGLDCLQDFARYTRGNSPARVKVVGTHALRQAVNRQEFIGPATEILQQPIDIISGEEEASLVYLGVKPGLPVQQSTLVVDIGGGSTELVTGLGGVIKTVATVPAGCVSYLRFFPDGRIDPSTLTAAETAARAELTPVASQFAGGWKQAVGCSGTLLAVAGVLCRLGLAEQGQISRKALQDLRLAILQFGSIAELNFQGLNKNRRNIFAPGVAIVTALFDSFGIDNMQLSPSGLREGIAWHLLKQQGLAD
jgi:exopolyphosphatase/guanosine-5'-triphosphate,3'-diphosphate pyrophosphatase